MGCRNDTGRDASVERRYRSKVIALFLLVVAFTLVRSFNAFLHPILHFEDGTIMLGHYKTDPSPWGIFRFYSGYVSLLPNLVGHLSSLLPARVAPYAMGLYSLGLTGLAYAAFSMRRFRFVLQGDTARIAISILLAALPLGNYAIASSTTYSLWHLLWLLVLLVVAPLPRSRVMLVLQFCFLFLAACSHPLSAVCLPLCAVLLLARPSRSDRVMNAGLIVAIIVYLAFGVDWSFGADRIGSATLPTMLGYLSSRVVFESFLGSQLRVVLHLAGQSGVIHTTTFVILGLGAAVCASAARDLSRRDIGPILGAGLLIVVLTWLVAVTRFPEVEMGLGRWEQRYFYVQKLLFVTVCCIIAHRAWSGWRRNKGVAALLAATILLAVGALNVQNRRYYHTEKEHGTWMSRFLRHVDRENRNKKTGRPYTNPLVFPRGGRWDIRIDLDRE